MGILDGIVEWIAEQVMNALDLITTSVLGALGCSMDTFLRYFPAAEDMYEIFVALALGLVLLNWIWQLFKNYFAGIGVEAEDPIKLSIMTFIFIFLIFYANDIVNLLLDLAGTPYSWILSEDLPPLEFGSFNSVITVILGVCANGAVAGTFFSECSFILRLSPLRPVLQRQHPIFSKAGAGCSAASFFYC